MLEETRGLKIWGQVKDSYGMNVERAIVTLFRNTFNESIDYIPVATTFTDSMGFYEFYIEQFERGKNTS